MYTVFLFFCRKLQPRLGGSEILAFYNRIEKFNFRFLYINCAKNYLINCVDQLLLPSSTTPWAVTMFANQKVYVIHEENELCRDNQQNQKELTTTTDVQREINLFLAQTYPKNKTLPMVFQILSKRNIINDDLFFTDFPQLHVADICTFLNNRFGEKQKINSGLVKFCKYIKNLGIKIPKIAIKNPVALKLLH